jgi:hypothetical protein
MSGKGAKGLAGKGAKGTMAGDKKGDKKKPISRSAKAGLQFPVGRIHRFLKVRPPRPTRLRSATHTPYQNPHAWTSPGHFQTHAFGRRSSGDGATPMPPSTHVYTTWVSFYCIPPLYERSRARYDTSVVCAVPTRIDLAHSPSSQTCACPRRSSPLRTAPASPRM